MEGQSKQIACGVCGQGLASKSMLFNVPGAEGMAGAYVNAYGAVHQTMTLRNLQSHCEIECVGSPSTQDSWFPGYAWTIVHCARCYAHLGWHFTLATTSSGEDNDDTTNGHQNRGRNRERQGLLTTWIQQLSEQFGRQTRRSAADSDEDEVRDDTGYEDNNGMNALDVMYNDIDIDNNDDLDNDIDIDDIIDNDDDMMGSNEEEEEEEEWETADEYSTPSSSSSSLSHQSNTNTTTNNNEQEQHSSSNPLYAISHHHTNSSNNNNNSTNIPSLSSSSVAAVHSFW